MPNNQSVSIDKSYAEGKILQSVMGAIGVVTFHNPEKRNAMSLDMWAGLGDALADLRVDPSVRVVVMTGAGDKAFISGDDIGQFDERRKNLEASEEFAKRNAGPGVAFACDVVREHHLWCIGVNVRHFELDRGGDDLRGGFGPIETHCGEPPFSLFLEYQNNSCDE